MNQQILNVAFEEDADAEAILSMKEALSAFGEEVSFYERSETRTTSINFATNHEFCSFGFRSFFR